MQTVPAIFRLRDHAVVLSLMLFLCAVAHWFQPSGQCCLNDDSSEVCVLEVDYSAIATWSTQRDVLIRPPVYSFTTSSTWSTPVALDMGAAAACEETILLDSRIGDEHAATVEIW